MDERLGEIQNLLDKTVQGIVLLENVSLELTVFYLFFIDFRT